jgi:hypothetical protein
MGSLIYIHRSIANALWHSPSMPRFAPVSK